MKSTARTTFDPCNSIRKGYQTKTYLRVRFNQCKREQLFRFDQCKKAARYLFQPMKRLGRTAKEIAAEIGEELIKVKASLKHGEFGTWCADNLSFTHETRSVYMKLAKLKIQDNLKFEQAPTIETAVKGSKPKPTPKQERRPATKYMQVANVKFRELPEFDQCNSSLRVKSTCCGCRPKSGINPHIR